MRVPNLFAYRLGLAQAAADLIGRVERPGHQRNVGAFGGQPMGDARADTPAGSGDHCPPSLETARH